MAQTQAHGSTGSGVPHGGHPEPNYLAVIVVLAVMTALEIGVIFLPIPKISIGILLVGLALSKACLVAMYFMHLKFERRILALIAATPLILCALLMFALLPDSNPQKNKGEVAPSAQAGTEH